MVIRQRAMQAADKQERHDAILDAAEQLLGSGPDRLASMSEVADEAGLAKGTVYLYFASKEELYLAVHERNIDAFFRDLIGRVEATVPLAIDDVLALTRQHMLAPPLFLPLAARCFGAMAHNVPPEAARAFQERMAARLARAGAGLEHHFPQLRTGDGVVLLRHSYALIIGLWQMSAEHCPAEGAGALACAVVPQLSYAADLERALRALWRGSVDGEGVPT